MLSKHGLLFNFSPSLFPSFLLKKLLKICFTSTEYSCLLKFFTSEFKDTNLRCWVSLGLIFFSCGEQFLVLAWVCGIGWWD